jgi:hypothetical protein
VFHSSHVCRTRRFSWRARALITGLLLAGGLTVSPAAASAATITVTAPADDITPNDGTVSLREAITSINAGNNLGDPDIVAEAPGVYGTNDTINFNISGSGRHVISVGTSPSAPGQVLPTIIKPVTINGYFQPGASANTLANGDNAVLEIALNGASAGANADGLQFGVGSGNSAGSTLEGLDIFGFSANQVELRSPSDIVTGNDVGFDTTGSATTSALGVLIAFASNDTIGGTSPAARNVISGNVGSGVEISGINAAPASGNVVEGNFIGTGPTGTSTNGNGRLAPYTHVGAVLVDGGNSNTIGGTVAGARNVIGGNGSGVDIRNGGQNNLVQGNFIGVGADGVSQVPNSDFGVHVGSDGNLSPPAGSGQANEPAASSNSIGGTVAGAGNLIEFNGGDAVLVDGTTPQNNATQAQNSGNSVLGNSILSNGGLGIDLEGVAANPKPNNLMSAPTITAVTPGASTTVIQGTLSMPGSGGMTVRVELFSSPTCDAGGSGEGQQFLGFVNATTDGSGNASFSTTVAVSVPSSRSVTATATNTTPDPSTPAGSANLKNTSEFSQCFPPLPRTLTVSVAGTGSGTVTGSGISCPGTCSQTVPDRSSVTLTATPAADSTFTGWSGACSGSATCELTMQGDQSVTATFAKKSAPPPPPPPPPPPKPRPKCKLAPKSATVVVAGARKLKHKGKHRPLSGTLSVTVTCDQAAAATVTGTLTELLGKKPRHGKQRTRTFKLGPARAALRAGRGATLKLQLPAAALGDLLHKARESVTLSLSATNSNGTSRASYRITKLKGRPG